jgi:tetratricopeptide (TPR) repeat protein
MNSKKDTESLAEKYAKKGKFNEAISEYKKLLTEGEEDIPIRNIIGDLYIKSGQEDKAAQEFRQIAVHYEEKKIYAKAIALYKRITRLDSEDHSSGEKLAELLSLQGYLSEAKDEYRRLAKGYMSANDTKNAIKMYRLLINLDREDTESRLALVDIFEKEEQIDQAVEELNGLAELKIVEEKFEEARELLDRARNMDIDYPRTLFNLIGLLKRDKKDKEALSLVKNILEKDEKNIKALKIFGNLLIGQEDHKKAEDIFYKILEMNPHDISARVKLGTIHIHEKNYDKAYAIFEPIVDSFLKRKKEDKAISLLGLILRTKVIHTPTLEKIAAIYEIKNQPEKLRLVYRILLNQHKKDNNLESSVDVLRRMVKFFPEDQASYREYKKMRKALGVSEDVDDAVESIYQQREAEMTLEQSLSQADLYIEQGLIRIAKRFLENLKIDFPEEPEIEKKLEAIKVVSPDHDPDKISEKVGKIMEKQQTEEPEAVEEEMLEESVQEEEFEQEAEEVVSVQHIFEDTDIIPFSSPEDEAADFFDLAERINEELKAIDEVMFLQKKRISSTSEKPLTEIIKEFKKDLSERMHEASDESRYNLGIAFMEQGLWVEAIEEFKLASRESFLTVDSFLSISLCHKNTKHYEEAVKWIQKAMDVTEKDSNQYYSLKYELASLFEEMGDHLKAMQTFIEVKGWKSDYRNVGQRLKDVANKIQ